MRGCAGRRTGRVRERTRPGDVKRYGTRLRLAAERKCPSLTPCTFGRSPGAEMIYEPSPLAVAIFVIFVGITLALSFYLGARAKSAAGYFAAGGGIHWFVN